MPVLKVKNGGAWINVSGGSGASVQSDWTINDETNPAHIKNRPFYEEPNVWVSLLPSTEFGPFYISPMFGIPIYDRNATYDLIVGETYRITWDGVAYECVAQDISSVLPGGVGVGNGTNFGLAGNNEPFIVCILNGAEGYISLTDAEAGGSHTVSIEEIGTVIHKVDGKYLPDGIGYTEVITKNETFDIIQIANDFGAEWTTLPESESPIGKTAIDLGIESEEALINFTVGNEYQVVINGISYTSNAADLSSVFGMPILAIGDYDSILSQDSSNFKYMVLVGQTDEGYFAFDVMLDAETFGSAPTEFTISGLTNTEIIHKVDSKYLPEDVAFLDDIPEVPSQIVNTVNGMTGDVTINIPEVPVTSVNGMTGDVTIEIPESPVTSVNGQTGDVVIETDVSWNDLTDKPFEPEVVYYEWDADVIYDTVVEVETSYYTGFAKISDNILSSESLLGKNLKVQSYSGEVQSAEITESHIQTIDGGYTVLDFCIIISSESAEVNGVTLTKGVWCLEYTSETEIKLLAIVEPAKTIDESVIPSTIARVEQLPKFSYEYSTEDLIPGISELETGKLYFVYE